MCFDFVMDVFVIKHIRNPRMRMVIYDASFVYEHLLTDLNNKGTYFHFRKICFWLSFLTICYTVQTKNSLFS